jgi:hypothetical protein
MNRTSSSCRCGAIAPVPALFRVALLAILGAVVAASMPLSAQEIYKTVDENGNVVYTDRKPSEDAEPVSLPELTVVDPVELGDASAAGTGQSNRSPSDGPASDFGLSIVSPQPEETVRNTAYRLEVDVATDRELPSGTSLVYLVDGEVKERTRALSTELQEVWRGEHQLSVELRSGDGEVLASAGPVTFYMHQPSRLRNPR